MTCIVGLADGGSVYIGGDSAGVDKSMGLSVRADRKVFRNGDFVMGFTTSFRMGQLLAHSFKPPKRYPDTDVYAYMVNEFVDAVRECLKKGGYAKKEAEAELGGTFLVGYAGRLFEIFDDYQVGDPVSGFSAVGCGGDIAIGSLYSTEGDAKSRVMKALHAAEQFSGGVRAPFHIEVLPAVVIKPTTP